MPDSTPNPKIHEALSYRPNPLLQKLRKEKRESREMALDPSELRSPKKIGLSKAYPRTGNAQRDDILKMTIQRIERLRGEFDMNDPADAMKGLQTLEAEFGALTRSKDRLKNIIPTELMSTLMKKGWLPREVEAQAPLIAPQLTRAFAGRLSWFAKRNAQGGPTAQRMSGIVQRLLETRNYQAAQAAHDAAGASGGRNPERYDQTQALREKGKSLMSGARTEGAWVDPTMEEGQLIKSKAQGRDSDFYSVSQQTDAAPATPLPMADKQMATQAEQMLENRKLGKGGVKAGRSRLSETSEARLAERKIEEAHQLKPVPRWSNPREVAAQHYHSLRAAAVAKGEVPLGVQEKLAALRHVARLDAPHPGMPMPNVGPELQSMLESGKLGQIRKMMASPDRYNAMKPVARRVAAEVGESRMGAGLVLKLIQALSRAR